MARRNTQDVVALTTANNQIMAYTPSAHTQLAGSLVGLRGQLEAAARAEVMAAIEGGDFTETEIEAMVTVQALKNVNAVDLTAVLLRADYIRKIQEENMLSNHPGHYTTLEHMAREQGISAAELSQTLDLVNIIFPYFRDELEMDIAQVWNEIGKSNLREMVPVLKSLITGSVSDTGSTRQGVMAMLDSAAATLAQSPQNEQFQILNDLSTTEDEDERLAIMGAAGVTPGQVEELLIERTQLLRHMAVQELVDHGIHLPNRELRRVLRPDPVPVIQASAIQQSNGQQLVMMSLTQEQRLTLERLMREKMEVQTLALPVDPQAAQAEAFRVAEVRALLEILGR